MNSGDLGWTIIIVATLIAYTCHTYITRRWK